MLFADTSRGRPFSKDPAVVHFLGHYWMYYTKPSYGDNRPGDGFAIGIARSDDLENWTVVGEITPADEVEKNGLCAPGAFVRDGLLHLFYQNYGNGRRDAICHATSRDGLTFQRDPSNPVFRPTGEWNCGRAIDADVIVCGDELLLFFATRDPEFVNQMLGVASAPLASDFSREHWTQRCTQSILKPELPWEQECIEAPALGYHGDRFYLFYGGAYNNKPQQIGLATSPNGLTWTRFSDQPFLPNGAPGSWNQCESGHPYFFQDPVTGRDHLFFQGDADYGKSWYLSRVEIVWENGLPVIRKD